MFLTFVCENQDGRYVRCDEKIVQKMYSLKILEKMLLSAGFDVLDIIGGFDFSKADENKDERAYFVCRKNAVKQDLQAVSYTHLDVYKRQVLTYPRTDSRYISDDIVPTLGERLKAMRQGSLSSCVNDVIRTGRSISKTCVNNAKVSDHHAIIPTEQAPDFSSFNTSLLSPTRCV